MAWARVCEHLCLLCILATAYDVSDSVSVCTLWYVREYAHDYSLCVLAFREPLSTPIGPPHSDSPSQKPFHVDPAQFRKPNLTASKKPPTWPSASLPFEHWNLSFTSLRINPLIPHQPQITFNDVIICYTSLSSAYNEWTIISHFLILAVINVSKNRMHRWANNSYVCFPEQTSFFLPLKGTIEWTCTVGHPLQSYYSFNQAKKNTHTFTASPEQFYWTINLVFILNRIIGKSM